MRDADFEELYDQIAELNLRMLYLLHRVQFVRKDGTQQTVVTAWERYHAERDAFLREVSDGRTLEDARAPTGPDAPADHPAAPTGPDT